MRLPIPSLVLDINLAPMGPGILSSSGAVVWRKGPGACPDCNSVLDAFQEVAMPISILEAEILGGRTLQKRWDP